MDSPDRHPGDDRAPGAAPTPADTPQRSARSSAWSRRRFLGSLGALAVGAVSIGAGVEALGLVRPAGPSSQPSGGVEGTAATGPAAGAAASPSASAAGGSGRRAFRSRPELAPPVITLDGRPERADGRYVFLTPSNGAGHDGPTIVDSTGELVWMRPDDGKAAATDLHVVEYAGVPALIWWQGALNAGIGQGEFAILDTGYRQVATIRAGNGRTADLHDLRLTTRGTALLFADAPVSDPVLGRSSAAPVMDCAVQEIDLATGRVLFEWHSIDHIGLDESFIDAPTAAGKIHDYVHGNSIEEDTDGNLLVSARNTSTVYKVDRTTGRVMWRLGGKKSDFRIAAPARFGWQHDVRRRYDGTITLFDNSAAAAPGRSQGLRIRLDESAGTASLVAAYVQPRGLLSTSQGNVQILENGNLFIGWGSQPFFSEFAADGSLLLDGAFTAATQSYRSYRLPWVARPAEPPALAVERRSGGAVTAYASWNGATDVATWELLAGEAASDLRVVATARRTGFETAIDARSAGPFVAVRARDVLCQPIGTSAVTGLSS